VAHCYFGREVVILNIIDVAQNHLANIKGFSALGYAVTGSYSIVGLTCPQLSFT